MRKYQTEFKLKVVKSFLNGDGGAKLLARQCSVPEEKIRTWVSHFRLHGIDGLRPKRSKYSAQFKLQVLSHQDREQLSSRQVACFDNAVIESFFGTLKAEYFHLASPNSVDELEAGVHDYVRYYNHERIKLRLKGLSPVEYRLRNTA